MADRKNPAFIGAYVSFDLKRKLQQQAQNHYRTLSQEITRILEENIAEPQAAAKLKSQRRASAKESNGTR